MGVYDAANKEMLAQYLKNNNPDGEIIFLTADPETKMKGIGRKLLSELERRESGKKLYLYTDSVCTYKFYEGREFEQVCRKDAVLDIGNKEVPLQCLLYSKVLEG